MGNSQPVFNRLDVPSFGLVWLNLDDDTGDSVVLIPGGGGSTKSGVKNQIQIGRYIVGDSRGGFEFLKSFETDVNDKSILCSGVAVGTCMGSKVVCTFLDNHCAILTVNMVGNEIILKRVVDFKADFSADGSVNCACILPSGHLVTGGDDGICRLWAIGYIEDKDSKINEKVWRVRLLSEMKGHSAAIMDISHHPDDALICTAAKDGSCKMWNIVTAKMVCDIPCVVGLPGSGVAHKQNSISTAGPVKMECRGCCFSSDGDYIYIIQSARRGATHLIEWAISQHGDDILSENLVKNGLAACDPDMRTKVTVDVSRTKAVSKFPCTRLKMSEQGEYLAIGASDGAVVVVETDSMKQVFSLACHDLPATGLGFAPLSTAKSAGLKEILTSCSADNRLAMMKIKKGFSVYAKFFFAITSLLCFIFLIVFSAILLDVEIPKELIALFVHNEL